ncbi:serine hydrolase domain-containing protein [Agrobacterium rubi]|uniref:Serine hydrolase n=2 Tax=Agrobacterium rubi TaxID=28099 RepID=A0AAE7UT82_9HYPH|nr:serine hydrolase [Agrobacterium rubi]MBP1878743.1 CubicO group peptidase (beta-lactamase class C family) [Agrobacterium rubi]MCL6652896.1 serine hydrolase [Agrobacterium rubi]NTE88634.1 serine hydrolase [Agrobacterium rubi]NTF04462.1 serine hydrolase [Agrobacterium rubi]NTF09995.1 serine hydrolase [Agrobacterium rubi]
MLDNQDWNAASNVAEDFVSQWSNNEPGGSVIGFDLSGLRFACSGGVESLATYTPFSPKSVVRYASVTKHVFCAMVLENSHLIALEDPLDKHIDELQSPLRDVTVGQALDMSGGLPDVRECLSLLGLSVYTETKAAPLLDYVSRLTRLNFPAGSEVSYSNTGYRLVEAALERNGLRFDDFVQEKIAAPFGVVLKAPDVWNDPVAGLVPGYWKTEQGWQLSSAGLHISASGSLAGSAEALVRWLQALLNGEQGFEGVLDTLSSERPLEDGRMSEYGLGLRWSHLGGRRFLGHGGSHPGYKTYFLLDPENGTGFVVVSNREDTNSFKIALESMAALTGLPLPKPTTSLPDGLYVTETGPWWLEIMGSTCTFIDADDTLYDDGDGWASSRSASSPMRLRADGDALVGEAGHAPRRFLPVGKHEVPATLSGRWTSEEGAEFVIDAGSLSMGTGPARQTMPLTALGHGRFLFTLNDGPWTKRVCLHMLGDDHLELVSSRARMIEYRRSPR